MKALKSNFNLLFINFSYSCVIFNYSYNVDREMLFNSMAELRVIKSKDELNVLRYVCAISSAAHRKVMRGIKPGMSEFQVHLIF